MEIDSGRTAEHFDLTAAGAAYHALSAAEKRERIWKCVLGTQYKSLPPVGGTWTAISALARLLRPAYLRWIFSADGDSGPARLKAVGRYGAAAQVRLVPAAGHHRFTGVFTSGGVGLLRASWTFGALLPTPNVAIKFFIDGHRSRNLLARAYTHQPRAESFFAPTLSNELGRSRAPLVRLLVWYLHRAVGAEVAFRRVEHLAGMNDRGERAGASRLAPRRIYLVPLGQHCDAATDFRVGLAAIPLGTRLYRMEGELDGERFCVGDIVTESPFLASRFGDECLVFRHVH